MTSSSDTPWSLEQVKDYFKKYSNLYDKDVSFESYPAPFIIASWVKQEPYIAAREQVQVMDLGCGTGASSQLFFDDHKYHVHGIDATQEMLDKAQRLPFKSLNCQNLEEKLNAGSETFDAVVCVGVFDFIVDKKRVFNEMSRILKIGGVAGITMPDSMTVDMGMKRLLEQANLNVIKSESFFGYRDSTNGVTVTFCGFLLKKI